MTKGTPTACKKHRFSRRPCCQDSKMTKMIKVHSSTHNVSMVGNRFLMDFGFVRGPNEDNNKKGNIIASFDGYTSYLLITDEISCYSWIFLTKDKTPPINTVDLFFNQHGLKGGMRRVQTDQGGELAKSTVFRNMIRRHNYVLETTGSDTSFQNGK